MPVEDQANALLQRGIQHAEGGDVERALESFAEALVLIPGNPVVYYNRGLVFQKAGRREEALNDYRVATGEDPNFTEAWINQAYTLVCLGRFDEALGAADRAIQLQGNSPSAWLAKGNALKGMHALGQAADVFAQGLRIVPEHRELKTSLANTKRELGQADEAISMLREIVGQFPDFAEAQRDLAHALLLSGDYLEGWKQNRWRWQTGSLIGGERHQAVPEWTGQTLTGKRILLWDEQGFGDAIQFVRFVPWVAESGAEVVLEVQPELVKLFQTVNGVGNVIARGDALPQVDYQVSLLDLGDVFRTDSFAVPDELPYLSVEPIAFDTTRPRVGLCWAGNPNHDNDRNRSMTFELIRPWLNLEGIDFFNLQFCGRAKEVGEEPRLQSMPTKSNDFLATAQFVASLDLVITIDSAMAHLAGALGKPVWVLLPYAPDWRWMLSREHSHWYPSAALFRQSIPGDWSVPLQKISEKLLSFRRRNT